MIKVSINNEKKFMAKGCTVAQLLNDAAYDSDKVAVAINQAFVPRTDFVSKIVHAGDQIDILSAMQGG